MEQNPRFNKVFNKGMTDHSSITMKKILETYSGFESLKSLVDVGGGTGAVINMIVSKYPTIKGINFDLPHVIEDAPSYPGILNWIIIMSNLEVLLILDHLPLSISHKLLYVG